MNWLIGCFKNAFMFRYFLLGIIFAFLMQIYSSCSKNDSNPVEPGPEPDVDVSKIEEGAANAETAFASGEAQNVLNQLTDETKSLIGNGLSKVRKADLVELGNALKSRELVVYSDMYAEYKYTKDGVEYTVAFARKDENTWKLQRF